MRINHNLQAMNTHRQLGMGNSSAAKSMEKLSSGYRINRAGDDAAGLAISEKMRGQIRGLSQASRNAQDGISMIQTAEGALNETHSILQRMRELSVQAANDTLETEDRLSIGDELVELTAEIDRIASDTEFNGKTLLDGSISSSLTSATNNVGAALGAANVSAIDVSSAKVQTYTFSASGAAVTLTGADGIAQTITAQAIAANGTGSLDFSKLGIKIDLVSAAGETAANIAGALPADTIVVGGSGSATFMIGANEGQDMTLAFSDMATTNAAGINLSGLIPDNTAVNTSAKAEALVTRIDTAISFVNTERGKLGASQNRLEHTITNLDASAENLQSSESRIRDVDMAKEMMEFTKNNILTQASQAMLAQANQAPQGVLQLLR